MKLETCSSPAISVIVPIYNMEKLMRKCLDSILAQTFEDYECLLIDDGSKDGSPAICDEYAAKDSRIKAFHKPNGGLSDARNYGLERAQGDYTIFFDPDDWVDVDCLKDMYAKAVETDADMVMCDLYSEDEYVRHYLKQQPSSLESAVVLKELFQGIRGFTVNKLIKRALYKKYSISYPLGVYGCEDQYVMAQFFMNDINIAYLPKAYYHYMYYSNSLSRHYDENTYQMDIKILEMFETLLSNNQALPYAYRDKSSAVFTRAFWYGGIFYNSLSFEKRFGNYKHDVWSLNENSIVKCCMFFSCYGLYRPMNRLVFLLFSIKRLWKKITMSRQYKERGRI